MFDVDRVQCCQPDIAVNAGAGIPARVWLLRVVDLYCNYIWTTTVDQMRRQLVYERAVTVRTLSEIMTVDPHLAIAVNAVELDKYRLPFRSQGHREGLAVPTNAARQRAAASARRSFLTELAFDAPVVRQIQTTPLGIVQIRVLSVGNIAKLKAPILVERNSFARPRIGETEVSSEKN